MNRLWKVGAVQDLARYRIEERLRAFRLLVIDQQADEVQFGALPQCVGARAVQARTAEFVPDARGGFLDAAVIEIDAIARHMAYRAPVGGFEMVLGGARAIAEQRVVAIEAVAQHDGDRPGGVVGRRRWDGGEVRNGARGHQRVVRAVDGIRTLVRAGPRRDMPPLRAGGSQSFGSLLLFQQYLDAGVVVLDRGIGDLDLGIDLGAQIGHVVLYAVAP